MKIIDLLNKIANGEELPKKINYGTATYLYNLLYKDYADVLSGDLFFEDRFDANKILNEEVEILDEEDEFEDIEEIELGKISPNGEYIISVKEEEIQYKFNQLIKNQKKIIERLQHENSKDNV